MGTQDPAAFQGLGFLSAVLSPIASSYVSICRVGFPTAFCVRILRAIDLVAHHFNDECPTDRHLRPVERRSFNEMSVWRLPVSRFFAGSR